MEYILNAIVFYIRHLNLLKIICIFLLIIGYLRLKSHLILITALWKKTQELESLTFLFVSTNFAECALGSSESYFQSTMFSERTSFLGTVAFWEEFYTLDACMLRCFSCVQLCSPPGSSVHGILQTRIEWMPFPSLGDIPDPGIKLEFPELAGGFFTTNANWEAHIVDSLK